MVKGADYMSALTTTQIAAISEGVVAAQIMAASAGRLSMFAPMADDHGIDLLIYDKLTGKTLPIQVKAWTRSPNARDGTVQFDIRASTIPTAVDGVFLVVVIPLPSLTIENAWLIPMSRLDEVATERRGKYALVPSTRSTSRDRYTPFRVAGSEALTARLLDLVLRKTPISA